MMRVTAVSALLLAVDGLRSTKRSAAQCGAKGVSTLNATSGPQVQIVNGDAADECEWKWQVGIMDTWGTTPWCGGTLIAEDWVFTAAHCVKNSWAWTLKVVAGQHKISTNSGNEQYRGVSKVIVNSQYNSRNMRHDYALLKLKSPMEFNKCVGAACLPTAKDVTGGESCWITGWGTLKSGGRQPDVLQEVEVNVLSLDKCRTMYRASEITDDMICAQGQTSAGETTDACQGDSGGPLVCQQDGVWRLFGATSWGYGCADPKYPGVWSRVHDVLDWVDENMA